MKHVTETAQQFIKRKEEQFEKFKKLQGKKIKMKDIGRKGKHIFVLEAWTFLQQHNLSEKVFVFERLRKYEFTGKLSYQKFWKKGEIEYRIGYFIVGKIGRAKGKWIWGQFCPLIPHKDLKRLLDKAKKDKVII